MNNSMQKNIFLDTEGDNWFSRNKSCLSDENFGILNYTKYISKDSKVLEIGCSNAENLRWLNEKTGCKCFGVEPSEEAVKNGLLANKDFDIKIGTADNLDYPDEYFDFVFFGFCLYLVDRKLLSKAISEADRVLKNSGYIGIIDFDTKIPIKRPYKHLEGINSYKMDYSKLFLAFPHYVLVEKLSYTHSGNMFSQDVNERLSSVVLFKDYENGYFQML